MIYRDYQTIWRQDSDLKINSILNSRSVCCYAFSNVFFIAGLLSNSSKQHKKN